MFFCHVKKHVQNTLYISKTSLRAHGFLSCILHASGRRAYKTFFADGAREEGSVSVEAAIALPLFIMFAYALLSMGGCYMTRAAVYEGLHETAAYLAEYSYVYEQTGGAQSFITAVGAAAGLSSYVDNKELVEKYVEGGMAGLKLCRAELADDNCIYVELEYELKVDIPLLGGVSIPCEDKIRQRAYLGYDKEKDTGYTGGYVYVTDTGDVYHSSRDCYHIRLTIERVSENELANEYGDLTECKLCAKYKSCSSLYVTAEGDRYHYYIGCSGLKRTVYRRKQDACTGIRACSECAK